MSLNADEFSFICGLIKERSGISLSDDKMYLLESRLLPVARNYNLENLPELVAKVKIAPEEKMIIEIIEAMTTNETSFFRDITPFDNFRDHILPHMVQNSIDKNLRVWCAACSSGQEPYSLIMTAMENAQKLAGCNLDIVATDIDTNIIRKAEEGIYTQFEVQRGLPIQMLMKYFKQEESYGEKWVLNQEVKDKVKYQYLNLLKNYDSLGKFDTVFCRNVLIYFEPDIKSLILNKIAERLKPKGILVLGSAETVTDLNTDFKGFRDIRGVLWLDN